MVKSKNPLLNMKLSITPLLLLVGIISSSTEGFICHPPRAHLISLRRVPTSSNNKRPSISSSRPSRTTTTLPAASDASIAAASTDSSSSSRQLTTKHQSRLHQIRSEGGPLSFNTKYGALNPYAIYYGLTSIALGIIWFAALSIMQLIYKCTGGEDGKFDKKRRIPVFLSHVWGYTLMMLTGCFPTIENGEILRQFHTSSKHKAAMFVSNHNSWMDIPFIGYAIGWHNYKFVAKKELERVPILGKAIMMSRNVCVDRNDRKSQLMTLKSGMKWLEDGVNLCTFPEGTRSRTNRLMPFLGGAFKMAQKAGAPVIPLSIVGAANVMPSHWMFPYRPAGGVCKVVVHEPVESVGKTEEELNREVREKIIEGLPEEQRPLE